MINTSFSTDATDRHILGFSADHLPAKSTSPTSLSRENNIITKTMLRQIVKDHPDIEELMFDSCYFLNETGLQLLAPLKRLQTLSLRKCHNVTRKTLQVLSKIHQIRNFDLSYCDEIQQPDVRQFIDTLPSARNKPYSITTEAESTPPSHRKDPQQLIESICENHISSLLNTSKISTIAEMQNEIDSLPEDKTEKITYPFTYHLSAFTIKLKESHLVAHESDARIIGVCQAALLADTSFQELQSKLGHLKNHFIGKALQQSKTIEENLDHGMSRFDLFTTCLYIENVFKQNIGHAGLYYLRKWPELPRSIQYDQLNKNIYIHLGTRNIAQVGSGCFKQFTCSILYNRNPPEMVVQGRAFYTNGPKLEIYENEAKFLRKLNGIPGIVKTYAITKKPMRNSQEKQHTFIQKKYNGGSLDSIDYTTLTPRQKEEIALSLLEGLKNLHERGILHNDLNASQLLVEFLPASNGSDMHVKAVIADFGEAIDYKDNAGTINEANILEEASRMGEILSPLFFAKRILYTKQNSIQPMLLKLQESISKGIALSRENQIRHVLLRLLSWSTKDAITAKTAYKELKNILSKE